jgi:hypothetical protein
LWWFAVAAWAEAPETLHPGELYGFWSGWTGTAYTTPKGMVVLHPLLRSSIGVTDFWDLKASIPGELFGPQLATEVAFVQNDALALSVEARGQMGWGFNAVDYGFVPHLSLRLGDGALMDLSFGVHGQAGTERLETEQGDVILQRPGIRALRPELTFDLAANEMMWLVFTARSDLIGWDVNGPHGALGAYLAYGHDLLGFSLGLNLAVLGLEGFGEDVNALLEPFGGEINPPTAFPIPLPHAQLWFRM